MSLAVALVLLAARVVPARQPRLARWVAAALVGLLALGWWWLSTAYLPAHHDRARARDTLRSQTFEAPSDQGAHARWLLAAATPQGFGLARVPWCGARAQVGIEPCPPKGHGPNRTFVSDLPVLGLFVTWGYRAGIAVLAALAGRQGLAPAALRAWVVGLLATTALVQAALVSAMNLGVLALSGLGLLVVDIATGQIEVAASSSSPCYAQWHASNDKQPLSADCPRSPPQQGPKPLNLRNAALYFDAMPGSLAKLLQGLTLLDQGAAPETLRPLLLRSDTEGVIDLMFCADHGFDLACANRHLSGLADWAGRLAPPPKSTCWARWARWAPGRTRCMAAGCWRR